jgi:hypothetical protein
LSVIDPNGGAPAPAAISAEPVVVTEAPAAPAAIEPVPSPEPAFTPHTETPSLLSTIERKDVDPAPAAVQPGAEPAAEPVKPVEGEVPKPEDVKPADGDKPAAEAPAAAEPIVYADFEIPEGFQAIPEKFDAFKGLIGKHGVPQETAQALVQMHTDLFTQYAANTLAEQHKAFSDYRAGLRTQVMADNELGGAAHQTTMAAIARARDRLVDPQNMQAFNDMLNTTGVGDHPEFLRILHRAARLLDEPTTPQTLGRPATANGKPPGPGGLRGIYRQTAERNGG